MNGKEVALIGKKKLAGFEGIKPAGANGAGEKTRWQNGKDR
jgi:hypothetical protein